MNIQEEFKKLCSEFCFSETQILSHRRDSKSVDARQKIAKALRLLGFSYPSIGAVMNRDHTSIMHLCKERKEKC